MDTSLASRLAELESRQQQQMSWIYGQHRLNQVLIGALLESGALPLAELKRCLSEAREKMGEAPDEERYAVEFWTEYLHRHVKHGQRPTQPPGD